MNKLPVVALTLGDPAGVGPEIAHKALSDGEMAPLAEWILVGDAAVVREAERITGLSLEAARLQDAHMLSDLSAFTFGRLDPRCGAAGVEYVRIATEMCKSGTAEAMVTAPLNKEAVGLSGLRFSGHTEYIAELCGASESRMLLASERLSTVHVTTHIPLRRACDITPDRIVRTLRLGYDAMRLLGYEQPRIAVCGLNPHAGEHGMFGDEEERIIRPAIEEARRCGIPCTGPHAADTVFLQGLRGAFDLIVAMYHDQGHIPMKLADFEGTVNISLGIPIIRTSVDHGTAFDIAGKNLANPRSMKQAMRMAARMALSRREPRAVSD
jgi:4-hydroxythreonine-4-phosphate dehydrogenase